MKASSVPGYLSISTSYRDDTLSQATALYISSKPTIHTISMTAEMKTPEPKIDHGTQSEHYNEHYRETILAMLITHEAEAALESSQSQSQSDLLEYVTSSEENSTDSQPEDNSPPENISESIHKRALAAEFISRGLKKQPKLFPPIDLYKVELVYKFAEQVVTPLLEFHIMDIDVFKLGNSTTDRLSAIEDVRQQFSSFVLDQVAKNENEVEVEVEVPGSAEDSDIKACEENTTAKHTEESVTDVSEDDHYDPPNEHRPTSSPSGEEDDQPDTPEQLPRLQSQPSRSIPLRYLSSFLRALTQTNLDSVILLWYLLGDLKPEQNRVFYKSIIGTLVGAVISVYIAERMARR